MVLVPRQLLRSGMTGNVPYYGGRFTPAQAYAAAHPSRPAAAPPLPPSRAQTSATIDADAEEALRHLRDTGVITAEEYDELRTRASR
jgi:hypothetical protein